MSAAATMGRSIAIVATGLLLLTACSRSTSAAADPTPTDRPDAEEDQAGSDEQPTPFIPFSLDELQQAFNDTTGRPRLILLVDPI